MKLRESTIDKNGKFTHVWRALKEATGMSRIQPLNTKPAKNKGEVPAVVTVGKTTWGVTSAGAASGVRCLNCKHYYDMDDAELAATGSVKRCPNCRISVGEYGTDFDELCIQHDSYRHTIPENVLADTWYHVSFRKDWIGELEAHEAEHGKTPMIHVGTKATAERRLEHIGLGYATIPWQDAGDPIIYEIRIKPNTPIAEELKDDSAGIHPETMEGAEIEEGYQLDGVTRYVNVYEDPGAISLALSHHSIEVIGQTTLTGWNKEHKELESEKFRLSK